jgi:tRNA/tmRNA/rRNA uracil-C5-methylase (TrmA/RlmC/RlmD family)
MQAGVTASASKLPNAATFAPVAVAQSAPVINTAKLIQSIGQSEMRVGMRSNEFGNISISTTANKDMISAQISLDHSELAKALASHLPEMQAKLGGTQPMDVRIDMNGASTGQGAGTSGNMSNGGSDQSNTNKQQSAYTASSYSGNSVTAISTRVSTSEFRQTRDKKVLEEKRS